MPLLMARETSVVRISCRQFVFVGRPPPWMLWPALPNGWQARPGEMGHGAWLAGSRQPLSAVALAGVRTQEPRPRALPYKRQGQLPLLVRLGFGSCWGLFGGGRRFPPKIISHFLFPIVGVGGVRYRNQNEPIERLAGLETPSPSSFAVTAHPQGATSSALSSGPTACDNLTTECPACFRDELKTLLY